MILPLGLAFVAGLLSALSPCVLPLLPIVFGAAASEHRLGPAALACGVALSFVAIGLFVATVGFSIGLDGDVFRKAAAALLLVLGVVLIFPKLQAWAAAAAGPVSDWANRRLGRFSTIGLAGQFGVGLLLGAVWSPCVGPTLGAASVLAAQGKNLGQVALTMGAFGLGAAAPLLLLGMLSRETFRRWRGSLAKAGSGFKSALGVAFVVTAASLLLGVDKAIETALVAASPEWLTQLTTRF
ncbi:cytochrome c biogenesis protein transmembrane region [Methylocella silvestris BL2]|uniref:Cytochrome c biogenesis protein transmembrane region n=1 Tax=Methylocella silvestris (strain DSM 15510 / CIP 108128 / LMG 27833 / NCIMB 13906 / BL2) TaxID=395965 RepID=B8EJW9_METSB|nr:cytochrome c biogenesis protein CcdA [Methylocella silvestris]ACK49916.1 cytochrome c biogenesis protein transmembrane region [Methylocella silvestris BL2]